ncbi:unnamed protein product [Caenorhabditis auriculariae]|uniref:Uncharacterized protein n=1 Tax=Caenorhabditis auriculariae TaxID=2777116 RepID=A0A8S1H193_9PELO|nr:unnamed protein product [Caenorhabditis auriculariae]
MFRALCLTVLLTSSQVSSFLFGGGCCQPVSSCCGGGSSWAYAPPTVIGYERIPLYAKVPMPPPQPSYVQPQIQQPGGYQQAPVGYNQGQSIQGPFETGVEVQQPFNNQNQVQTPVQASNYNEQAVSGAEQSGNSAQSGYDSAAVAPSAKRLRKLL